MGLLVEFQVTDKEQEELGDTVDLVYCHIPLIKNLLACLSPTSILYLPMYVGR